MCQNEEKNRLQNALKFRIAILIRALISTMYIIIIYFINFKHKVIIIISTLTGQGLFKLNYFSQIKRFFLNFFFY